MNQEQMKENTQGALQTMTQTMQNEQTRSKESLAYNQESGADSKKNSFNFSFDKEQEIDKELRKPRSRAYMEVFDAIDMLSATDEEIIAKLKANMDEDTAEEFSNMTAEEILEEIKLCFQEEFQSMEIEIKSILCGVLSKCYIDGCDCHAITSEGDILDHFEASKAIPDENLERGRRVFKMHPDCRCVEVYTDCCRVVENDSTVIKIPNNVIM